MGSFNNLNTQQKQALLKFPVYISMLAATNGKLDEAESKSIIKLANTKSFSCDPLLADFFKEANKAFENNLDQLFKELADEPDKREAAIKTEIQNLEKILLKLGKKYTSAMHHSMETFKKHVSKAHHSVIEDFVLPIPIAGLTD